MRPTLNRKTAEVKRLTEIWDGAPGRGGGTAGWDGEVGRRAGTGKWDGGLGRGGGTGGLGRWAGAQPAAGGGAVLSLITSVVASST